MCETTNQVGASSVPIECTRLVCECAPTTSGNPFAQSPGGRFYWPKAPECESGTFSVHLVVDDSGDVDGSWYLFSTNDSFVPLLALVRADSFESAYESALDNETIGKHLEVSETDAQDYPDNGEGLSYSDGAQCMIDPETCQMWPVTIVECGV